MDNDVFHASYDKVLSFSARGEKKSFVSMVVKVPSCAVLSMYGQSTLFAFSVFLSDTLLAIMNERFLSPADSAILFHVFPE